jgi:D-3-phosphoglycerate dehydrogenase
MKIICITQVKHLDGVYDLLEEFGNITYVPDITKEELKSTLFETKTKYLFTNPNKQSFILDEEVLKDSNIKVINTCSTGTNHIDMKYCKENNIEVWHLARDYELINQLPSTAEHAFGLMLSLIRKIPMSFHSVRDGNWDYEPYIGRQLKGLTVGIIGYGRLGKMMETYCHAFGMTVKIHDPYEGYDDLDLVLRESDVISLHVHVTGKTVGMINGNTIKRMKKKPYLINTSRGEIVYEKKVIEAIENGNLSGYATDVITDEFGNIHNSKLVEFSMNPTNNVIITPHVGGMTWEGQTKAYKWAINKFKGVQNEVN